MTETELMQAYDKWDYPYKPKLELFLEVVKGAESTPRKDDYDMEHCRINAYYSGNLMVADCAFDRLACLMYYAMVTGTKTAYDHVLCTDDTFEYKLNHLMPVDDGA